MSSQIFHITMHVMLLFRYRCQVDMIISLIMWICRWCEIYLMDAISLHHSRSYVMWWYRILFPKDLDKLASGLEIADMYSQIPDDAMKKCCYDATSKHELWAIWEKVKWRFTNRKCRGSSTWKARQRPSLAVALFLECWFTQPCPWPTYLHTSYMAVGHQ